MAEPRTAFMLTHITPEMIDTSVCAEFVAESIAVVAEDLNADVVLGSVKERDRVPCVWSKDENGTPVLPASVATRRT